MRNIKWINFFLKEIKKGSTTQQLLFELSEHDDKIKHSYPAGNETWLEFPGFIFSG